MKKVTTVSTGYNGYNEIPIVIPRNVQEKEEERKGSNNKEIVVTGCNRRNPVTPVILSAPPGTQYSGGEREPQIIGFNSISALG